MNFTAFLESIPILISGMLGIFIVTGIIIGSVYGLNILSKVFYKEDKQ